MFMRSWVRSCSLSLTAGFISHPLLAVSSDYITASELEERLLARTYYVAMLAKDYGHYDIAGAIGLKTYRFHENGIGEFNIASKQNWESEFKWSVKPDGRLCMPNKNGDIRCWYAKAEDDYLLFFNKRGDYLWKLSPRSHGM